MWFLLVDVSTNHSHFLYNTTFNIILSTNDNTILIYVCPNFVKLQSLSSHYLKFMVTWIKWINFMEIYLLYCWDDLLSNKFTWNNCACSCIYYTISRVNYPSLNDTKVRKMFYIYPSNSIYKFKFMHNKIYTKEQYKVEGHRNWHRGIATVETQSECFALPYTDRNY